MVGGLFKPTSFAGLFGAAPSFALATLALTISKNGRPYASTECRSMMAGAAALCLYSNSRKPTPEQVSDIGSQGHSLCRSPVVPDGFRVVAFLPEVATAMTVKIDLSGVKQTKWHEYI